MTGEKKFPVMEIFGPTIQGEGKMIGKVSHFVRFGGCGYRCTWCDSMHAVDPELIKKNATYMTSEELVTQVLGLRRNHKAALQNEYTWVTLSGGDPVMWDLSDFVNIVGVKLNIAVETQGQIYNSWLENCHHVTVSPKPPSSGMAHKIDYGILDAYAQTLNERMCLKVVIGSYQDLDWAEALHARYSGIDFYLSVLTPPEVFLIGSSHKAGIRSDMIDDLVQGVEGLLLRESMFDVTILPQLHTLMWLNKLGV